MLARMNVRPRTSAFLLLFVVGVLVAISNTHAAGSRYTPLTPEQVKVVTHSSQRLLYTLAGDWQRFVTGSESEIRTVTLPFSESVTGEFHYRRTFNISQDLINRYEWQLQFLGSNYKTQVFVNGQYLQSHAGGSTPFQIRIPDQYLVNGNNTLEIVVNNELDALSTIPVRRSPHHAKIYGGIYRELFLVGTSDIYFTSVETHTAFQGTDFSSGSVQVTATISAGNLRNLLLAEGDSSNIKKNAPQYKTSVEIGAELRSSEDSTVVSRAIPIVAEIEANRNVSLKLTIPISSLKLWSPSSPSLYTFVAQIRKNGVVIDDYTIQLGLYNVEKAIVDEKQILLLNGQPITVKALDYVEDSEVNRQTLNMAEYEKDIIAIKTLGANMIRVRYNTPHPYLSYLCDKYGLFIMVELPLNGVPATIIGRDNYIVSVQLILREMMQAYENHPSTLAWGISDSFAEGAPEFATYSQRLHEIIRPNSSKLIYKTVRDGALTVETDGLDFIIFAINRENAQSFRAEAERLQNLSKKTVTLFSFGKIIYPNNHNGYSDPLSIEAQAKFIRTCFRTLQEHKISNNIIITSFNDYQAERPMLTVNNEDQFTITTGLVSRIRDTRVSYQMFKALLNDEKEPILETGNYLPDSPALYTIVSIFLLITFFILINTSRRFREDVIRALLRPYNFYTDIRDQRILSNAGTFTLALILSGTLGILLSSVLYFLRFNFLLDYILTHLIPSDTIKEFVNTIIWIPWASFIVATLVFMVLVGIVTLIIRAGSLFVKARILMSDAFVIAVWACIPLVFLLPMTMGLYKLLAGQVYTQISLVMIVGILIWCLYRVLRGTSVIYDVRSTRIYLLGIAFMLLVATGIALYYNSSYATFAYVNYFFSVLYN